MVGLGHGGGDGCGCSYARWCGRYSEVELELYVVSANESEIRLSRALSGVGGLNLLEDAYADRIPVEGRVVEQCKGGFHVEVCQRRAFCPISQIDLAGYRQNHQVISRDGPQPVPGDRRRFLGTLCAASRTAAPPR